MLSALVFRIKLFKCKTILPPLHVLVTKVWLQHSYQILEFSCSLISVSHWPQKSCIGRALQVFSWDEKQWTLITLNKPDNRLNIILEYIVYCLLFVRKGSSIDESDIKKCRSNESWKLTFFDNCSLDSLGYSNEMRAFSWCLWSCYLQ